MGLLVFVALLLAGAYLEKSFKITSKIDNYVDKLRKN
jgi:hypothetical protein